MKIADCRMIEITIRVWGLSCDLIYNIKFNILHLAWSLQYYSSQHLTKMVETIGLSDFCQTFCTCETGLNGNSRAPSTFFFFLSFTFPMKTSRLDRWQFQLLFFRKFFFVICAKTWHVTTLNFETTRSTDEQRTFEVRNCEVTRVFSKIGRQRDREREREGWGGPLIEHRTFVAQSTIDRPCKTRGVKLTRLRGTRFKGIDV